MTEPAAWRSGQGSGGSRVLRDYSAVGGQGKVLEKVKLYKHQGQYRTVLLSVGEITRPKWMISVSIYLAKEREKEVVVSFPFPVLGRRNT